ncbi:glutathione S-transferase family protein [Primorskyibacter sedentarius]|uniref:glutathione S-transferase family protein n=1 Tax=Primorskyibacter sedentarius TaxID=745311 RepID=UPI003EC13FB3
MYKVVGGVQSRSFRVLWCLEELDLPYEHLAAMPRSAEVTALSPLGKIPVLVEGDAIIPDSTAILAYLTDKHGQFTCPAGTLERARQDALTFRILDEIDATLWTAARHSFILPKDERVPEVKPSLKLEYARNIERLTGEIRGPFLMGDALTVPDIILGHCAGWARTANFPDAPAAFVDYLRRLRGRPGFKRAVARGA